MAPRPPVAPEPGPLSYVFPLEDEDDYAEHFRDKGFVVVAGVLSPEQIDSTVDEIWQSRSLLGGYPHIRRDAPETWGGDEWPAGCRNFLDPLDPCSENESWRNRTCPAVGKVFEVLWRSLRRDGEEDPDGELVVSVDRFGVMRPARVPAPAMEGEENGAFLERPEWRTSRNWLHWDQNPWSSPGFFGVQGLLSLSDASATSGGFVTVPGFHQEFFQWSQDHPEGSVPKRTASMVPFPVPLEDEMQNRRVKVLVPAGALLAWDSRMPHENFPNEGNDWRLAQYVTYKRLNNQSLSRRSEAWRASIRTGLVPARFARSFSAEELARLGMSARSEDVPALEAALQEGENLSQDALEAAQKLRRAYRLKQTAVMPNELIEAKQLFQAAFAANPALREPLQRVAAAEDTYLPFWIL